MALDLLSEKDLGEGIPRRYRHEAESFAWSLICLCLSTVEDRDGKNCTRTPHPLRWWFEDWETSRNAKIAFQWRHHDQPNIPLVHSNVKTLAFTLHGYWVDQYDKLFPSPYEGVLRPNPRLWQLFGREAPNLPKAPPPYQELAMTWCLKVC